MKSRKTLLPLLLLAAIICSVSCSRTPRHLAPYGWSPEQPEFDSLTRVLEKRYVLQTDKDSIGMYVKRLREIADMNPSNSLLNSRATFWQGRYQFTSGDYDEGMATMRKALQLTDSAKHPFDFHRILWNLDMDYHEPTLQRYEHLIKEYNFFRSSGDDLVSAALAMEIGVMLNNMGDTQHGIPFLNAADSLFNKAGFPDQVANNRINYADALTLKGDTLGAVKMLRKILADTVFPISDYARDIAVGNLYNYVQDTTALRQAYNMVRVRPRFEEAACLYENFLTAEKLKASDLDSAIYYNNMAEGRLPEVYNPTILREYLLMRSKIFQRRNMPDSALVYLYEYSHLNDSIMASAKEQEIRNAVILSDIREAELQRDIKHRKSENTLLLILAAVVIVAGAIGVVVYRRLQKQKMQGLQATLDKERSERKMMAMQAVLQEKENILGELDGHLKQLADEESLPPKSINALRSTLRSHFVNKTHDESFVEAFSQIDPAFSERLRKAYPSLTAADLRLASLVVLGMEIKHIARVMAIRPESVKQARWRLRSKMGLKSEEDLSQVLKSFLPQKS